MTASPMSFRSSRPLLALFLALLVCAPSLRATPAGIVRVIDVVAPEGLAPDHILEDLREDEGLPLGEDLISRHMTSFGDLGWVGEVDVDIRKAERGLYDLTYRLFPRGVVEEVRFEGNALVPEADLRAAIRTRPGRPFDLREALDDGLRITELYDARALPFSGVLSSEHVRFEDGVLTYQVVEARLAAPDVTRLAEAGVRTERILDHGGIVDLLADAAMEGLFDIEDLELELDFATGEITLGDPTRMD